MVKYPLYFIFSIVAIIWLISCSQEPSPAKVPKDELESFELASGLKIALVAMEPMIQEPVAMQFDEDGRLWVVQMRGFMTDIDRNGEEEPTGRVSVLMDTNRDGQMDSSVVFADSLVLPRALALTNGGVLIAENLPLWFYVDLDGDLQADRRTLVDSVYGETAIVEHSPNGLWRGMDGWFYNAKSRYRYKLIDGKWIKDETEFKGQWGMSHDDKGRLFYNYNWSQLHADLVPPNYLSRNPHHQPTTGIDHGLTLNRRIYPIRPNLAANRGNIPGTLDESGRLQEFTSACSPFVYRGDALPDEFRNDVFVCEPTGNLIKRNVIEENDYLMSARDAYDGREFLASKDERFRPVALTSGPDGALYVADMYRGIIQHGLYMTEYLRNITLERNLDAYIHLGRIWKIIPPSFEEEGSVALSQVSTSDLVNYLKHKNGWYRDMAQRLMIEKQDQSIIPDLSRLVLDPDVPYTARIQAMWTIEGISDSPTSLFFEALGSHEDQVKILAIRLLEKHAQKDNGIRDQLAKDLIALSDNASINVSLQIALSSGSLGKGASMQILKDLTKQFYHLPLFRDAIMSSLEDREFDLLSFLWTQPEWQTEDPYKAIMLEVLASAIATKGDPGEISQLLDNLDVGPDHFGWQQQSILNGLALHSFETDAMAIALQDEPNLVRNAHLYEVESQQKIKKLSEAITWPGKKVTKDEKVDSDQVQIDPEQLASGRQQYLNVCAGCHGMDGKGINRFAPPLRNSEWVLGSEKRLALILIHGLQGPVEVAGKEYKSPDILPEMPSFSVYDDNKLAAIMTYIRREWGHQAPPVTGRSVSTYRIRGQGKMTPWTEEELNDIKDE